SSIICSLPLLTLIPLFPSSTLFPYTTLFRSAAHKVHREMPAYSVSKAAVRMLCKCFALELAPFGITVNELAPGYVQAGLSAKVWNDNPERKQEAIDKVPLKSLITVEEIAQQVLFLSDSQNKHITGTTFLMDGGLSLL